MTQSQRTSQLKSEFGFRNVKGKVAVSSVVDALLGDFRLIALRHFPQVLDNFLVFDLLSNPFYGNLVESGAFSRQVIVVVA